MWCRGGCGIFTLVSAGEGGMERDNEKSGFGVVYGVVVLKVM